MQFMFASVAESVFTLAAAYIFIHPLHKREGFLKRAAAFGALLLVVFLMVEGTFAHKLEWDLVKQGIRLLTVSFAIWQCVRLNFHSAMYVSIWSVVLSRFVSSLWIGARVLIPVGRESEVWQKVLLFFFYALVYVIVYFSTARKMPQKGTYEIGPRQMISAILFFMMMEFLTVILIYGNIRAEQKLYYLTVILAEIYCLSMLYIQTELFKKSALEKELLTMNLLWQQQKEQYRLTRENIDLINRKCHDLKHQVKALRQMDDDNRKEKYFRELEESVQIYDAIVKTGNEVVDTILTEKSLYCEAHGIQISCIVDGGSLTFVDPVDLYAILGNALDNAIEEVSGISDQKKRLIDLAIFTREKFLVINISNPLERELQFKGGLPVTTKSDRGYHGFGLRSIRHNVQQYGGYMNVSVQNGAFVLKMIIPLPDQV